MANVVVEVPQELSDIKDLIVGVARDLKAGKKPMEVVFGAAKPLEAAFGNLSAIPSELRSPGVYRVGALFVADMLEVFLPPAKVVEAGDVASEIGDAVDAAAGELNPPAQVSAPAPADPSPLV